MKVILKSNKFKKSMTSQTVAYIYIQNKYVKFSETPQLKRPQVACWKPFTIFSLYFERYLYSIFSVIERRNTMIFDQKQDFLKNLCFLKNCTFSYLTKAIRCFPQTFLEDLQVFHFLKMPKQFDKTFFKKLNLRTNT